MQAVGGGEGTLPAPRRQLHHAARELRAEELRQLPLGAGPVLSRHEKGIAQTRPGPVRRSSSGGAETAEKISGLRLGCTAAPGGVDEDVGEARAGRRGEALRMAGEMRCQLGLGGLLRPSEGLDGEAHSLDQPPAGHQIAPFHAETEGFFEERVVAPLVFRVQEAHVSHQAPADHLVPPGEVEGEGLAVEHLLGDLGVDECAQLRCLW